MKLRLLREEEAEKENAYLNELDVRKPFLESILQPENVQPGLEFDNFKSLLKSIIFIYICWLIFADDCGILEESEKERERERERERESESERERENTCLMAPMSLLDSPTFFCLQIYGLSCCITPFTTSIVLKFTLTVFGGRDRRVRFWWSGVGHQRPFTYLGQDSVDHQVHGRDVNQETFVPAGQVGVKDGSIHHDSVAACIMIHESIKI